MNTGNGKLMMAFDCVKSDGNLKNAIKTAATFSKDLRWTPQAVSVISPQEFSWPYDFTESLRSEFEYLGKDALSKLLKQNASYGGMPTKVLMQPYRSRKESVQSIVDESKRKQTSAIAVFTHAHKKGFHLPGGFVSSLIATSTVPILALNCKAPTVQSIRTILVATDFSNEGAKTFAQACDFAAKLNAKIILLHILPTMINETMAASAGVAGGWGNVEAYLADEEKDAKAEARRWLAKAKKKNVDASFELVRNSVSISGSIVKMASRSKADLIVVTQKIGPFASFMLGSVTRDVLASALQPVLVMPTRASRLQH